MELFTSKVDKQGRILIPGRLRKQAGIRSGNELLVFFENGGIAVLTREAALAQIDRMVQARLGERHAIVDEFLAERHREAEREAREAEESHAGNRKSA